VASHLLYQLQRFFPVVFWFLANGFAFQVFSVAFLPLGLFLVPAAFAILRQFAISG
jgi:hypothetical protein